MTQAHQETGEGTDLWRVIAPLVIWALHFLFCYAWAAVACQKAGREATLGGTQSAVLIATGVALALIGAGAVSLRRGRSLTDNDLEFEHNTPEERHRFLGHMALMLAVLGAVGVIYVAIPVLLLDTCR